MSDSPKFTWIPFYEEFALKLLEFKDNRSELVEKIKNVNPERIHFLTAKTPNGDFYDIDPFSVFAIFNRSSNTEKRQEILITIKDSFGLKSEVPDDFDAIPLVNAQKACFYYEDEKLETIPLLWSLFEAFMEEKIDDIKELFDKAQKRKGIRWNLTMAFFWMKPKEYMPLDAKSRNFIQKHLNIKLFNDSALNGGNYLSCVKKIKEVSNKELAVLSNEAWLLNEKMEVNGLMVQDNSTDWPDQLIEDMDGDVRPGAFWWHENPVGKGDTIKLLRDKLKEDGSFDFYIFRNREAVYRAVVADFVCSQEEYSKKADEWKRKNTQWLKDSFAEFNDNKGKRTAKILFYVEEMEKLENPISMNAFVASKDYKKPHITKLVPFKRVNDASDSHREEEMMDISKYVELLEANHNIILHGAPGTGKTYLAKKIAETMGAECEMIQFHQSYDYTDFVEGLRPKGNNGNIFFERQDGVFKSFCEKALKNLIDSKKNVDVLKCEKSNEEKLFEFLDDSQGKKFKTKTDVEFTVSDYSKDNITFFVDANEKIKDVSVTIKSVLDVLNSNLKLEKVNEIRTLFGRKNGQQADSYIFSICHKVREMKTPEVQVQVQSRKNFIFVIDEINRGEISKIFGELFYSIESSYRVSAQSLKENLEKKNLYTVKTQYSNALREPNEFDDALGVVNEDDFGHFFVPENVYIIGTMNDIDRSVESMDFAMRRRFAFKEVKADDRIEMLDSLKCGKKDEAVKRMQALNKEIEHVEGLSSAYHIGPAYFLKLDNYSGDFDKLWEYHIKGLLEEYFRGMPDSKNLIEKMESAYMA